MSKYWDYSENPFNARVLKNFLLKRGYEKLPLQTIRTTIFIYALLQGIVYISNVLQNKIYEPEDHKAGAFLQKTSAFFKIVSFFLHWW